MSRKTDQKWRKRYAEASYRLRKQYQRLEARYPESVALEYYGLQDFESLRDLGRDYPIEMIKKRVRMFETLLKEGTLSLQRHRRAYATAAETLKQQGISGLNRQKIGSFFRFMDDLKSRGIVSMRSSRAWAKTFTEMNRKKLSKEDMEANIAYWSKQYEKNSRYKPAIRKSGSSKSFR